MLRPTKAARASGDVIRKELVSISTTCDRTNGAAAGGGDGTVCG